MEETARGSNDDVGVAGHEAELVFEAVTADEEDAFEVCAFAEFFDDFEGLEGEFAGGREDDGSGADFDTVGFEFFEHGDNEGGGFAGACACHADDVEAFEDEGDCFTLDWGRDGEAFAGDCF